MPDNEGPTLGRPATPDWLQEIEDEERQAAETALQEPEEPVASEPATSEAALPEVEETSASTSEEPVSEEASPEAAPSAQDAVVPVVEEPELILGRYKDAKELIPAYQELRELQQRTGQEKNEYLRRVQELEQQVAQLQVAPPPVQTPPQFTPEQRAIAESQGMDENMLNLVQSLAAQEAERRTQQVRAQLQQQEMQRSAERAMEAQRQEHEAAIYTFRQRHPEVIPNSEDDQRHAVMFQTIAGDPNLIPDDADAFTPSVLDAAWEAVNDPDFLQVIRANPAYIDTDDGVAFAKMQATLLKATRNGTPIQAPQAAPAQRAPAVESGGQGAPPAPSGKPLDDYDKMMQTVKEPKTLSI